MVENGKEALGSMGNGAPLAAMAMQPRLMYEYFRQLFSQVTNPPIDPIRESIVMSLETYIGPEVSQNLLPSPILTIEEMNAMKNLKHAYPTWPSVTIDITFPKEGLPGYQLALQRVCSEATQAIEDGVKVIILPDHATGLTHVPLLALVACGGVHHHLVLQKMHAKVALMVEMREAREVHHLCVLVGYGTDPVCPWLMMETICKIGRENLIKSSMTVDELTTHYHHSIDHGILEVMSKVGISMLQSYKGAQILALHSEVAERCFIGTASRVQGATFDLLALDTFELHECGWPTWEMILPAGVKFDKGR
ncbi:glutamate synthase [Pisolithus albus]|nr:glutamate synthase [Pisolithus albus]